ncbi:hypothetical protein BDV32DRAFT_154299 [Aspergillus pseudonomiae]|nr:hypothetical protein BDV32DRAFT_154299 [Aspergillus pseudonomiae]
MSWETHILDPDGEVNILLECPDYHFAPWNDHEEPPAEEPPAEESPAEELPAEEPPAEEPPAEGHPAEDPIIFEEQLEEVCTSIVLYNKLENGGGKQTKLTMSKS